MKPVKKKKLQEDVCDDEEEDLKHFDMKAGLSALAEFTTSEAVEQLKIGMSEITPMESDDEDSADERAA